MHKFLFTFQSTHQALTAEKTMKKEAFSSRLIPTPTEIFAECGFSLEVAMDEEQLEEATARSLFRFVECYMIAQIDSQRRVYEKIHPGCP